MSSLASAVAVEGNGPETSMGRHLTIGCLQPTVKLTRLSPASSFAPIYAEIREREQSQKWEEVVKEGVSAAGTHSGHLELLDLMRRMESLRSQTSRRRGREEDRRPSATSMSSRRKKK